MALETIVQAWHNMCVLALQASNERQQDAGFRG